MARSFVRPLQEYPFTYLKAQMARSFGARTMSRSAARMERAKGSAKDRHKELAEQHADTEHRLQLPSAEWESAESTGSGESLPLPAKDTFPP